METFKWPLWISSIGRPTGPGHRDDGGHQGRLHRATIVLLLTMLALVTTLGCSESDSSEKALRDAVVTALDTLAADLLEDRPADAAAYTERLQTYLAGCGKTLRSTQDSKRLDDKRRHIALSAPIAPNEL